MFGVRRRLVGYVKLGMGNANMQTLVVRPLAPAVESTTAHRRFGHMAELAILLRPY